VSLGEDKPLRKLALRVNSFQEPINAKSQSNFCAGGGGVGLFVGHPGSPMNISRGDLGCQRTATLLNFKLQEKRQSSQERIRDYKPKTTTQKKKQKKPNTTPQKKNKKKKKPQQHHNKKKTPRPQHRAGRFCWMRQGLQYSR